ncbi:uncharacterized mitochondrial protein AtMg00810-like [Gastrolobium bilobum]|uniref:uncharacterized mitochondrial protein AtMg00810-like n=1 Tax=Gastrolobium bilobum TaxID=150636 RepID=UPI002AAF8F6E|nr:uncharacterized mitochondrial protein AtMg00810-like [Gastrolobium bilobum]
MSKPLEDYWQTVKRILRYLKGTCTFGLLLQAANPRVPFSLTVSCDADWASDPNDRRTTFGACLFLGPNLVSWWLKRQTLIARSTVEAENRSLALACSEVLWVKSLFSELQLLLSIP